MSVERRQLGDFFSQILGIAGGGSNNGDPTQQPTSTRQSTQSPPRTTTVQTTRTTWSPTSTPTADTEAASTTTVVEVTATTVSTDSTTSLPISSSNTDDASAASTSSEDSSTTSSSVVSTSSSSLDGTTLEDSTMIVPAMSSAYSSSHSPSSTPNHRVAPPQRDGLSRTAITGVVFACLIVCGLVALLIYRRWNKHREERDDHEAALSNPISRGFSTFGRNGALRLESTSDLGEHDATTVKEPFFKSKMKKMTEKKGKNPHPFDNYMQNRAKEQEEKLNQEDVVQIVEQKQWAGDMPYRPASVLSSYSTLRSKTIEGNPTRSIPQPPRSVTSNHWPHLSSLSYPTIKSSFSDRDVDVPSNAPLMSKAIQPTSRYIPVGGPMASSTTPNRSGGAQRPYARTAYVPPSPLLYSRY